MPLHPWIINREMSRRRKTELDKLKRYVRKISSHSDTERKEIGDFPNIDKYLKDKFPEVDLSDVRIYITSSEVMSKYGFKHAGGCYIDCCSTILVKRDIALNEKVRGKFKKLMQESCPMSVEVEDVLVHELIHAVSFFIGRHSSNYEHMEEEFVYTNCIDFYKNKGMSDEDIVNNNFLPFCLNDVSSSRKEMSRIFKKIGTTLSDIGQLDMRGYTRFLNTNADVLVPLIKSEAQKKAHHMIELYHKYGAEMYSNAPKTHEDMSDMRFSSLDLE